MRLLPRFKKPRVDQLVEIFCLGLAALVIVKIINDPHPTILGMPLPAMPIIHDFGDRFLTTIAPLKPLGHHLIAVIQHPHVHLTSHVSAPTLSSSHH